MVAGVCHHLQHRRICNVTHQGAARDGGPVVLGPVRATPCLRRVTNQQLTKKNRENVCTDACFSATCSLRLARSVSYLIFVSRCDWSILSTFMRSWAIYNKTINSRATVWSLYSATHLITYHLTTYPVYWSVHVCHCVGGYCKWASFAAETLGGETRRKWSCRWTGDAPRYNHPSFL